MKKTFKSILAVISALVFVVIVCASCSKLGKCKCTAISYWDGEVNSRQEFEASAPNGKCADLNSENSSQSSGSERKTVITCVAK